VILTCGFFFADNIITAKTSVLTTVGLINFVVVVVVVVFVVVVTAAAAKCILFLFNYLFIFIYLFNNKSKRAQRPLTLQ